MTIQIKRRRKSLISAVLWIDNRRKRTKIFRGINRESKRHRHKRPSFRTNNKQKMQ